MAKNVKEDLRNFIGNLAESKKINVPFQQVIPIKQKKVFIRFSFMFLQEQMEWFRDYLAEKRKSSPQFFTWTASDVFKEGLRLLEKKYPNIEECPVDVPTVRGRNGAIPEGEKFVTSFSISQEEKDFIYNLIYYKSNLKDSERSYNKHDLIAEMIELLSKKNKKRSLK